MAHHGVVGSWILLEGDERSNGIGMQVAQAHEGAASIQYHDLRLGPIVIRKLVVWAEVVEPNVPLHQVTIYADKLPREHPAGPWSLESIVVSPVFDGIVPPLADVAILTGFGSILEQLGDQGGWIVINTIVCGDKLMHSHIHQSSEDGMIGGDDERNQSNELYR
jgi:hypothetical protein